MEWTQLILDKLQRWGEASIKMLPNLALAIVIFIAFYLLARVVRRLVYRISCKISDKTAISNLISGLAYFVVFVIGIFTALEVLKLDKAVSSLLAGAGIIGLALGFAFQDLTANFISGIYIIFRKPFDVGDVIETNTYTGTVENIQFRSTTMRTSEGLYVIIPNKDIFQKALINHSLTRERKIELSVLVPFNKEPPPVLEEIVQTIRNITDDEELLEENRPPDVYFANIEGNSLKLTITLWISDNRLNAYNEARHRLITRVLDALRGKLLLP